MSGNIQEALRGGASKKLPLLPPPPKIKKEAKTFVFDLKLTESNDQTYPEFSWTQLVRNAQQKDLTVAIKTGSGHPCESDDEEDLKAMAAKFEAKYNGALPPTKKMRAAGSEEFIDRGAGYDESDPFIDNSDAYDEVVPADLQTKHGGFYINAGSLDFKEVELPGPEGNKDEDDSFKQPPPKPVKFIKSKSHTKGKEPKKNSVKIRKRQSKIIGTSSPAS